ncbi:gamma-glutamyl kinase [compost metagenome]
MLGPEDSLLGRGIVNYDDDQLRQIAGMPSGEVMKHLNSIHRLEVIHRDEWITLK